MDDCLDSYGNACGRLDVPTESGRSLRGFGPGDTKTALLVAGVGRSGTSALTRVLNLLGARVPNDLLAPGPGNEGGFWEPVRIVNLSDEMLLRFDRGWHDSRPMPQDWFNVAQACGYVDKAAEIITAEYGNAPLIAIKDPRICRLAPVYLAALQRLHYCPRIIIPVREPSEMVASVHRRDGTDVRAAELIWIRHMLEIEAATRPYSRVWTGFDDLLDDWRSVVARIASAFSLDWPNSRPDAADAIDHFLTPSFRHFSQQNRPIIGTGPLASELWRCLDPRRGSGERRIRRRFDAVRAIVADLDRLNAVDADWGSGSVRALQDATTGPDHSPCAQPARMVADAARSLRALRNEADSMHRHMHRVWAKARSVRAGGSDGAFPGAGTLPATPEMAEAIMDALDALHSDQQRLAQSLSAMMTSRSWALTRPLRDVKSLLVRLCAGRRS